MSPADVARLTAAVRRLRRRLWLADLPRPLARTLWLSAFLLAGASLLRWRLDWPGPSWLSVLVLAPIAAAVLLVLSRRPGMEKAIRSADRLAEAGDLLLTTWELVAAQTPPPSEMEGLHGRRAADCGMGNSASKTSNPQSKIRNPRSSEAVVLARASRALPGWLERLQGGSPRVGIRGLWPPLAGLLAALPLLALVPSGPIPGETVQSPTARPAATAATDTPPPPLAALVEELRLAAAEAPTPAAPPPPGAARSPVGDRAPLSPSDGSATQAATDTMGAGALAPSAHAPAAQAANEVFGTLPPGTGGTSAGRDAAGGSGSETGTGDTDLALPASPLRTADIARHGQPQETAGARGGGLTPQTPAPTEVPSSAVAPALLPPGLSAGGLDLDPSRRMIAARYLELMQDDPQ